MIRTLKTAVFPLVVAFPFLPGPVTTAAAQSVTWANLVNSTVSGTVLQKTGGCDGCDDAGATSQQEIVSGDGYVEFTVGEATTVWLAGLSHGNGDTTYADIDFAFNLNGAASAYVRERGVYVGGDTSYAVGDTFRVAVVDGKVQYSKNGIVLRESLVAPQYPLLLDSSLLTMGATIRNAVLEVSGAPPPSSAGLMEKAGSPALRPRFTRSQIDAFLPAGGATGKFTFPAPYRTEGVRLTHAGDCGGQDCLWYVGYSYWRNTNNHVNSSVMYIFLGFDRAHGGGGPTLLAYNKLTDAVQNLGPLFDATSPYSYSTAEGWYFSARQPTKLYTFVVGGTTLRRYDVITHRFEAAPALDLNECRRGGVCPPNAASIFQPHSSDDDKVHSVTVQDAAFHRLGCLVFRSRRFTYYGTPAGWALDECHVDKSGRWLMLLESDSAGALRNRVVDLKSNTVTTIEDVQGALGHLDMGYGYAVGADNWNQYPNATILLKFPVTRTQRPVGPVVHFNKRWDIAAANHIAHGNAVSGLPGAQYACGSNAGRAADMADEIVCFSLDPNRNADGSLDVLVVGQVMTDLDAPGGRDDDGDDYEQLPKGNLDVTGKYFIWTANIGGDRLDAFIVKIPSEKLTATASSAPK